MTAIWRNTLTLVGATTLTFGMAHAQSPELSDPPAIEGDVVADHGSHTLRMGIGLHETASIARKRNKMCDSGMVMAGLV